MGGKTGINCFVLITGYFMCKSNITLKKFIKLLLEIQFYKIIIYFIFIVTGYETFSIKTFIKTILPIYTIGAQFTDSFLVFFLFIPFINKLIKSLNKKEHLRLIMLSVIVYTILPTILLANVVLSYVSWFMIIYFIASYIRIYPNYVFEKRKLWGILTISMLLVSWFSVLAGIWVEDKIGYRLWYFFIADSNKILALLTSICAFLYFKNLKLPYNKIINTVSASTFGVLMIHANSDTMRQWLWRDLLNNVGYYDSNLLIIHAIGSVIIIYLICTVIDILRIYCLERPLFKWLDEINVWDSRLVNKLKNY